MHTCKVHHRSLRFCCEVLDLTGVLLNTCQEDINPLNVRAKMVHLTGVCAFMVIDVFGKNPRSDQ